MVDNFMLVFADKKTFGYNLNMPKKFYMGNKSVLFRSECIDLMDAGKNWLEGKKLKIMFTGFQFRLSNSE